jgi:hypothetical protein
MTRQEYMTDSCELHCDYFSQFVTPAVISMVRSRIGIETLLDSTDPHLNDIPLMRWDILTGSLFRLPGMRAKIRDVGEIASLATGVCILKEAARQIIEQEKEKSI